MKTPYYRECLCRELTQRLERNPRYSLRAFAKTLDVPVSSLSRAISGQRSLSVPSANRIATKLRLSPRESALFIGSLSGQSKKSKNSAPETSNASATDDVYEVGERTFRIIADWYHFAILEMTFLKKFNSDSKAIAASLGISPVEATMAITRLKDAGLLEKGTQGLRKTQKTIWVKKQNNQTSDALIEHQKQCLTRAIDAVTTIPFSERASSTMTMPIDPKKIPLAQRMIEEFAIDLCQTLSSGDMSDVFQLTINFHSLLNKGISNEKDHTR